MKKLMFAVVAIGLYASSSMASPFETLDTYCYNMFGDPVPCAADVPGNCYNAWGFPVPCAE